MVTLVFFYLSPSLSDDATFIKLVNHTNNAGPNMNDSKAKGDRHSNQRQTMGTRKCFLLVNKSCHGKCARA